MSELATTQAQGGAITTADATAAVVRLVLDGLDSTHSKRAYERALLDFLDWHAAQGRPQLTKALVQAYRAHLIDADLAPSTINLRLAAIRKLATEAADNGLADPVLAQAAARVKGVRTAGTRTGNWLTRDQAQALLEAPDVTRLKGLRDRAILAVLLGCGLRRSEVAALQFDHVQQREARWVLVDLVGKGRRTRTVPMPSWAKVAIDEWAAAAAIEGGHVFRPIHKGGHLTGDRMSAQAVADVVRAYAAQLGLDRLAAHDLRRTFAKLAHKGGSGVDQIGLALGHASIQTTERYLGLEQDLTNAPCDHLGLRL